MFARKVGVAHRNARSPIRDSQRDFVPNVVKKGGLDDTLSQNLGIEITP